MICLAAPRFLSARGAEDRRIRPSTSTLRSPSASVRNTDGSGHKRSARHVARSGDDRLGGAGATRRGPAIDKLPVRENLRGGQTASPAGHVNSSA